MSWLSPLFGRARTRRLRTAPHRRPLRRAVEPLEDRLAPAVFTVNSLADVLNPPAGTVTLRSAIQAANHTPGGNTINLAVSGTYKITLLGAGEDNNASGDFDVLPTGGNLTVVNTSGGAVAIDGGHLDRVFDINPTFDANNPNATAPFKVTFQGLTIQNGAASPVGDGPQGAGGGIRSVGNASVELDNVTITNCFATGDGGAITFENTVNTPWTLTVNNSSLINNHANDAGGAIDTDGSGKVFINPGSVISGNTTVNQGAAIWLDAINNASATLVMTGTKVTNNSAFAGATGAIGNAGNGAVTIAGSLVANNFSGSTGGGFGDENMMGNLTVINSLFLNNVALTSGGGIQAGGDGTTTVITNSVITGNVAQNSGGGVFASGGTFVITNSRIGGNVANFGGGIEDAAATLTVSFSVLDNDVAVGNADGHGSNGGGIDAPLPPTGSVVLTNDLFLNDAASNGPTGNGGALFQGGGALTVANSQFTGNAATGQGGAVFFAGTTAAVTDSTFNANRSNRGGALYFTGTGTFPGGNASALVNDTFFANVSGGGGGAISFAGTGDLVLINDTINGNTAGMNGGGVEKVGSGKLSFENTIVVGDTAGLQGPDVFTAAGLVVTDNGGNILGTLAGAAGFGPGTRVIPDLKLGPLQNNGGQFAGEGSFWQVVQTEALLRGSAAIGTGLKTGAPTDDQRNFKRSGGNANPSVGAFEPQFATNATANQAFIESIYETLLGRTVEPGNGWAALLDQGASPFSVVLGIESSDEYRTIEVQALYQRYLRRAADAGGLQASLNFLKAGGSLEVLAAILVGSQEYFQLYGGTNEGFVNGLYQDALGRSADPNALAGGVQALAGGATRFSLAASLFASPEYKSALAGSDFSGFLGRDIDAASLAAVTQGLGNGLTDEGLLAVLLGSAEGYGKRS
jgi:predicted outer membrane repeat protein